LCAPGITGDAPRKADYVKILNSENPEILYNEFKLTHKNESSSYRINICFARNIGDHQMERGYSD